MNHTSTKSADPTPLFLTLLQVYLTSEKEDEPEVIEVRIWSDAVANLTLMALGSSAPEILLSVIEVIGNDFEAKDLGPGTIVGSAAFNLFVISAVCVMSIPNGEERRIRDLKVGFRKDGFFCRIVFCLFVCFQACRKVGRVSIRFVHLLASASITFREEC